MTELQAAELLVLLDGIYTAISCIVGASIVGAAALVVRAWSDES